ncbi:MAG: ABC transporter substrate-binding protein [Candidatus Eisenbacteria bacterium]|nr:ABC transporter substrate-binding protein [Candidatus Eisenbacteria bacterium]
MKWPACAAPGAVAICLSFLVPPWSGAVHASSIAEEPGAERWQGISRIVAVNPTAAEIVCALGACSRLVAVGKGSSYPPGLDLLPSVGFERDLTAEGILALDPDLVLLGADAGPPEVIARLRALEVPIVVVPGEKSLLGAASRVRAVAAAIRCETAGESLAVRLERLQLRSDREAPPAEATDARSVLFLYARGGGSYFVAGQNTAPDELIRLAGGRNACAGFDAYRPLSAESLVGAQPDLILLTRGGLEAVGGEDGLWSLPGMSQIPAGRERAFVALDDLLLLGFGPRVEEAILALRCGLTDSARRGR